MRRFSLEVAEGVAGPWPSAQQPIGDGSLRGRRRTRAPEAGCRQVVAMVIFLRVGASIRVASHVQGSLVAVGDRKILPDWKREDFGGLELTVEAN